MNITSNTLFLAGLLTTLCGTAAQADTAGVFGPLSGLYNTGVDNSGNVLPIGEVDSHYSITQNPHPTASGTAAVFGGWPLGENGGPYAANNSGSHWIRGTDDTLSGTGDVTGFYTYRLNFVVAQNADLASLSISGLWSTDNNGTDIKINGASLGFTTGFEDFRSLHPFSVTSGFQIGANTLDFDFYDGGVTAAFRVDQLSGDGAWDEFDTAATVTAVPETGAVFGAMALAVPIGWTMVRRKKSATRGCK